jgi:hypothetical protein
MNFCVIGISNETFFVLFAEDFHRLEVKAVGLSGCSSHPSGKPDRETPDS